MLKKINFPFPLFLFAITLVFGRLLLPGPKVAVDYHYTFADTSRYLTSLPYTWREFLVGDGLGEYTVSTLWSWPTNLIYGLLGSLGANSSILFQFLGIIPFIFLGIWGIIKLFDYFEVPGSGKWIGTLFYLTNTYILLSIDGGQINLALAYSLLPLAFVSFRHAIERARWKDRILFGLAALTLSIFDIRIIYFLLILIGINFILDLILRREVTFTTALRSGVVWSYLLTSLVVGIILIGFHAYWILPAVLAKAPALPLAYERPQQVEFLSFATLGHSLYLLQPHWFKNVFGQVTQLRWEFVFIPLLVFLAPILRKRDRWVGFWVLVALLAVFLSKGSNEPFPQVYSWLFVNIPGFSLFRDPTKFFFLIALSYSVLLAITVDELTKRFSWNLNFQAYKIPILPLTLTAYLLLLISPIYTGKMTGTFAKPVYQDEYFSLADTLSKDQEFGRVFWIPTKAPLGYSSPNHPSVDASRLAQRRPFAIGTVGTYEFFNFLREAPFMGEIFDIAGIKYIVYPFPDTRREELKQDNIDYYHTFLSQLSSLPWIVPTATNSSVPLLQTKQHQDHFFLPQNMWWVIGSDDIYQELVKIPGFHLANNAIVFLEEQAGLGRRLGEVKNGKILITQKTEVDLAANLLNENAFVFPAKQLDFNPNATSGWWKREAADLIQWRAFLQEKYGIGNLDFDYSGGWAVAEGDSKQLTVNSEQSKNGDILLARVMGSSRGGKVEFYQGETLIGSIDTKVEKPEKVEVKLTGFEEIPDRLFEYDKAIVSWYEIGKLTISHQPLTIKTTGDINVVNTLAVVPRDEWARVKERANSLLKERGVVWDKLSLQEKQRLFTNKQMPIVNYERVSPTHYKLRVSGLKLPTILAFSENYDNLWQIDSKNSLPIYSLINGFPIEGDGQYEVKFAAQKYIFPGFLLTITTLILVISLLVLVKR